ncbi:hypothetical protein EDD11_008131 [Mortierella claussenii]|nr:hypothetical protein EDD11_008131 [Mortierella claussenii]
METKSWILARIRGDGDGDGESADLQLCSSTECRPETDLPLVGSTMPLATHHFTNPLMLTYIGWDLPPPLANVLEHFQGILSACFRDDGAAVRPDEVAFIAIYRNLQDRVCSSDCLSAIKGALDNKPWILINGTLHTVERVAFNMSFDLSPHFVKITTPGLDTLFRAMGVREQILAEDLMSVMSAVADGYGKDESVSDTDQELLVKLLNGIVFNTAFQWSPNILIPTMDGRLCKIADVVFDDVNARNTRSDVWGIEGGEQGQEDGPSSLQYTFASPLITLLLADKLHIPMFSTKSWDDQRDSTFEPWAQEEKIVDRIKNILNDYDPASIFTEFLQNAADAGATECTFMLDQRSFGKTKVLSKGMAAWQGPALVIYNDAVFTESDFEGLSNIGVGNKRDDLSKIGRHGLGFNSVFHFTDVPSVVSGDYIGFFDPKKTYLPKSRTSRGLLSHGGQRCNFLKLKGDALEEQLAPYQGLFGCDMKSHFPGTIFRIPLRTLDVMTDLQEGSKIGEEWTLSQIKEMLESWSEDAKVGMLFLDTVKTIELTDSRDFTWTATKAIAKIKPSLAASLQDGNSGSASTRVVDITTHSSRHAEKQLQTWLIYTDSDFPADTIHTAGDFAQKHGWSAHRGIAIPVIQGSKTAFRGRLFAHLPTTIETGFRFHLHAGFALTSSRKSLAGGSDKGNPQTVWNDFLLQDCLPCTATDAFTKLYIYQLWDILHGKPKSIDTDQAIENYFRLWPVRNQCPQMEPFRINFSKLAYARPILPCRTSRQPSDVMPLMGQNVAFPGLEGAPVGMVQMIHRILQEKYVSICVCPHSVMIQLRTDWKSDSSFKFTSVNEDYVRKLIRNDPEFVPKYVKTVEDKRWLLEYTLKALLDPLKTQQMQEPIVELALLPLMNGEWKHMDPSTGCHTASADVRELISGRDVLVDESLFKTTVSLAQAGENIRMSPLESIFKKLTMTSTYGITPLSNAQFVSIFLAENPLGVPEDKKERLWRYLNKFQSLEPFGDIPLLETVGGRMVPLKEIHAALDLSKADHWPKQHLQRLATLLSEQGHIIIDSYQNKRHPFLLETSLKPDDVMVLKKISKICQNWPENRVLTKEEAETIRTMVMEASDDFRPHVAPLGILKIWPSWGAVGSNNEPPRICARGSFFTQGTFSLKDLGSNPDVIMTQYCKHFATMGARSLGVVKAASTRVLPKFQNGALKCTRSIKEAYMRMLSEIIKLATPGGKKADSTAKAYLVSAKSILARDGTFCASSTLYDPDDPLLSTVFAGVQSKFPDPMLWSHVQHKKHLFAFRNSSNSTVIRECAMHIMTMAAVSPADTITPATALVKHIYEHPGGVRWMDPQWKIVPAEVIQDSPQNEHAPVFPALMSFSELVHAASRDICWTQCAFFPVSLQPSVTFKGLFGNVGEPNVTQIVRHLGALSGDLALKWITTDHQLLLKMSLFKVYEALNLVATKDDASMEIVSQALRNNLAKPYILNGKDSDPSLPESWFWPAQLMLDIDNDIDRFHVVHKSMYAYRDFLVAAGVDQMQAVVGSLQVPDGRRVGEIEQRLYNCWVTQDEHNGFMDVRFKFAARQQILAHKFMLVHANDYFLRRFTGAWAEYTTRDKDAPGVEVIDLAKQEESYEAFWGLLHYFYTDQLIPSNGPPIAAAIMTQQEPNDDDSAPSIASASGSKSKQQRADELRDRLEFLMNLQRLANMYETPRLKALIACEVMARHVIHSNVFSVRAHAALNQSKEVQEHCDMFLRKNVTSVRRYLHGELQAYRGMLATLTSEDDGQQRAEIKDEIAELETNLRELNNLA